ncbi:hypothetical protein D043_0854A, partial [Vibrio parahaemolyticus EKP-021]
MLGHQIMDIHWLEIFWASRD